MAKRKFGASVIILCIAAITLISGTYAWFLVGGFASLFDLGFNVIEAGGSLELQGDAGTAHNKETGATEPTVSSTNWGNYLDRTDFLEKSFIVKDGVYKPVSSRDAEKFIAVSMEDDIFRCNGIAPQKTDESVDAGQICYNNFTFRVRSSTADEIVGSESSKLGAYMEVNLNGIEDSSGKKLGEDDGAAVAARLSVTLNSDKPAEAKTTIYSIDGEDYQAVTSLFSSDITDKNANRIIDPADTLYADAALAAPTSPIEYKALRETQDGELVPVKIYLGNLPANTTNGMQVTVKLWLEGNDKDCVDIEGRSIAGSQLWSHIKFGIQG